MIRRCHHVRVQWLESPCRCPLSNYLSLCCTAAIMESKRGLSYCRSSSTNSFSTPDMVLKIYRFLCCWISVSIRTACFAIVSVQSLKADWIVVRLLYSRCRDIDKCWDYSQHSILIGFVLPLKWFKEDYESATIIEYKVVANP